MPTYDLRRQFISDMYQPLFERINHLGINTVTAPEDDPTGWERVDRTWSKIKENMSNARNEEDFQAIGLQCREIMISVAQAVYVPGEHITLDGITPSQTDAKRMIESYLNSVLPGASNGAMRKHVNSTYDLANAVQHRRSASKKDALICMEATRTVINLIKIVENI